MRVEVTDDSHKLESEEIAIAINTRNNLVFNNVEVRGLIMGLAEETGEWKYPLSLNLGKLLYGQNYQLILRVIVPVSCSLVSKISGVNVQNKDLHPGKNNIVLRIDALPEDTLIDGSLFLVTSNFKRRIGFTAHILNVSEEEVKISSNDVIWEATEWPLKEDSQINNNLSQAQSNSVTEKILNPEFDTLTSSPPSTISKLRPGETPNPIFQTNNNQSPGNRPDQTTKDSLPQSASPLFQDVPSRNNIQNHSSLQPLSKKVLNNSIFQLNENQTNLPIPTESENIDSGQPKKSSKDTEVTQPINSTINPIFQPKNQN